MSSDSAFITDPEFCPECGTILPLPGDEDTVTCKGCKYKVNVKSKFGLFNVYFYQKSIFHKGC